MRIKVRPTPWLTFDLDCLQSLVVLRAEILGCFAFLRQLDRWGQPLLVCKRPQRCVQRACVQAGLPVLPTCLGAWFANAMYHICTPPLTPLSRAMQNPYWSGAVLVLPACVCANQWLMCAVIADGRTKSCQRTNADGAKRAGRSRALVMSPR